VPRPAADGNYNFLVRPYYVTVTRRERKSKPTLLYDSLSPHMRRYVDTYIDREEFTIEALRDIASSRAALNIVYFQEQSRAKGGDNPKFILAHMPGMSVTELTPLHRHQESRLVSYAYLR
jgi:hypothetical protein